MPQAPLSYAVRAEMFSQLAAMEHGGVPTVRALTALDLPGRAQQRALATKRSVELGIDVASSALRSGLFTEAEVRLLRAAQAAGRPERTYKRLAEAYAEKDRQRKTIRARLMMPLAVFVIGILAQPLPALVADQIGLWGYLYRTVLPLGGLALLLRGVASFDSLLVQAPAPTRERIENLLIHLPLFGPLLLRMAARDFFETLSLLLEGGVPATEAAKAATAAIPYSVVRHDYADVAPRVAEGDSFFMALQPVRRLGNPLVLSQVRVGEGSGSLPEVLWRHAASESAHIEHVQQQIAEWAPRLFYTAVGLWVLWRMLHDGGVMPQVPNDL